MASDQRSSSSAQLMAASASLSYGWFSPRLTSLGRDQRPCRVGGVAASNARPRGSGGIVPPAGGISRHPWRRLGVGWPGLLWRLLACGGGLPTSPRASPAACCGIRAAGRLLAGLHAGRACQSLHLSPENSQRCLCYPASAEYARCGEYATCSVAQIRSDPLTSTKPHVHNLHDDMCNVWTQLHSPRIDRGHFRRLPILSDAQTCRKSTKEAQGTPS